MMRLFCPAVLLAFLALLASPAFCAAPPAEKPQPGDALARLLEKDYPPPEPLLPPDATIVTEYKELAAEPVGTIDFVENEAYVLHADDPKTAYKAQKSKPVYLNDTLVAANNSRLVTLLKDQSQFSLAAASKATLDKVVYDPAQGSRDTVVGMTAGKARFTVQKLAGHRDEDFKVQTPLAVMGVRGSDFVVAMIPESELPRLKKKRSSLDWLSPEAGKAVAAFLDLFGPVPEALAQTQFMSLNQPTSTLQFAAVLTGADTIVCIQGMLGSPMVMSPFSISTIQVGGIPTPSLSVTPTTVPGVMNRVGPAPSVMGMPAAFE